MFGSCNGVLEDCTGRIAHEAALILILRVSETLQRPSRGNRTLVHSSAAMFTRGMRERDRIVSAVIPIVAPRAVKRVAKALSFCESILVYCAVAYIPRRPANVRVCAARGWCGAVLRLRLINPTTPSDG